MGNWPLWALLCALNIQDNLSRNTALDSTLNTTLEASLDATLNATLGRCRGGCLMDETAAVELDHNRLAGMPPSCLQGQDISSQQPVQVIPIQGVARVGSTMIFCCIVGQGNVVSNITYNNQIITATPVSSQIYAIILPNLRATVSSGNDVVCRDSRGESNGSALFVGFPPDDQRLECETDLVKVTCHWSRGRVTELYGEHRTVYTLNNRWCSEANEFKRPSSWCVLSDPVTLGEGNWTLNATNPLGNVVLTDRTDLGHRVHLPPPEKVRPLQVHAGNASVGWSWRVEKTRTLPLLCEAQLKHNNLTETRNYTGQGLSEVLLTGLLPDRSYSLQVRCGTELNFWKWSNWSSACNFRTQEARPDALDVWIHRRSNLSAVIMWKPLSANQSHGQIQGYEVSWDSLTGSQHSRISPKNDSFLLRDLGDGIARVTAFNSAGSSPPSRIGCPRLSGSAVPVSQILGNRSGFDLSWPASTNAACGYVLEWSPAHKGRDPDVDWVKLPPEPTWFRLPPKHFAAGLKYSLSVYSCSQGAPELLVRMEGYAEELAPVKPVRNLKVEQIGSNVILQWDEVPQEGRRGFIRGYSVDWSTASGQVTTENISGAGVRNHTFFGLPLESFKFTVRAVTSAGLGPGAMVSINLSPAADWLMWVTLVSLASIAGFAILTATIYFKKRTWCHRMMEKLYPVIPEPKLTQDWSTSPMLLLAQDCYDRVEVTSQPAEDVGGAFGGVKAGYPSSDPGPLSSYWKYQQALGQTTHGTPSPDHQDPTWITLTNPTYSVMETLLMPAPDIQFSEGYRVHTSPTPDLPLLVEDDYQPLPVGPGGVDQSDTPTFANLFSLLLGSNVSVTAQEPIPATALPAQPHGLLPHRTYTDPTYLPFSSTHV